MPWWDSPGGKRGYEDEIHGGLTPEARAILGMVYSGTNFLTSGKFWGEWLASAALVGGVYPAGVYYATSGGGIAALGVASGPGSVYVIGTLEAIEGQLGPDGTKLMELPNAIYSLETNADILTRIMSLGQPIRDLSVSATGELLPGGPGLTLEREMLGSGNDSIKGAGWTLQQLTDGYWYWVKP